ncbi:MAG: nicotinate (nicotinamide) nucleotide adenylyltransferase [Tepidisphaeraceae bacterium]
MKWLCLGGSFDPIHVGHVICARDTARQIGADGVRIIPAALNPHKVSNAKLTPATSRLTMCQLAIAGLSNIVVDDRELRRPPPSYTIETVLDLRATLPTGDTVAWLVGTDHIARLHTWHRFDELIQLADMVVMHRAGHPILAQGIPDAVQALVQKAVTVPEIGVSSTAIRTRVAQSQPINGMVHPAVGRFIRENDLYRL